MSEHDWQRWSTHVSSVRAYLRSVEWREDERAEVLSEMALSAPAVTPRRQDDSGVRSFFVGFAANLLRRRRREELRERALAGHLELVPAPPPDPEATFEQREELARVWAAIASLPEAQQQMLRLLAIDGLSPSEAARQLGIPEATARTRLYQARKNLEARLDRRPVARRTRAAHLLLALALLLVGGAALATAVLEAFSPARHQAPGGGHRSGTPPPTETPPPSPASDTPEAAAPRTPSPPPAPDATEASPLPHAPAPPEAPHSSAQRDADLGRGKAQAAPTSQEELRPLAAPPVEPAPALDTKSYQVALTAHLGHDAPAAIAAWTAFLATGPRGPLEAEARFRRAEARTWVGDWATAQRELKDLLPAVLGTGLEEDIERLLAAAP